MDPAYDREALVRSIAKGRRPKFLFFWGHAASGAALGNECLSQWYPCAFVMDGETYLTAEHYMMVQKARLFGDAEAAEAIFDADHPAAAKKLGRGVRGFDEARWKAHRFEIVTAASIAKFGQNDALRRYLLATNDRVIVEASPRDTIWGIGMGAKNVAAEDPSRWRGLNLLGFALMRARDALALG